MYCSCSFGYYLSMAKIQALMTKQTQIHWENQIKQAHELATLFLYKEWEWSFIAVMPPCLDVCYSHPGSSILQETNEYLGCHWCLLVPEEIYPVAHDI